MDIEQLKNELKNLGFTDDKFEELMNLVTQEVLDQALDDLEANVDDTTMEELAQIMGNQPTNDEEAQNRMKMIFEKAYGDDAMRKRDELITTYLKQTIEDTKAAKDLYARYQAGDPAAVAQIKAQEGNPDVQAIVDQMQ